jgi:hypothetical protein
MSVRNPANSSSGSSNPALSRGSGVAKLDNLVYYMDNHVDDFTHTRGRWPRRLEGNL